MTNLKDFWAKAKEIKHKQQKPFVFSLEITEFDYDRAIQKIEDDEKPLAGYVLMMEKTEHDCKWKPTKREKKTGKLSVVNQCQLCFTAQKGTLRELSKKFDVEFLPKFDEERYQYYHDLKREFSESFKGKVEQERKRRKERYKEEYKRYCMTGEWAEIREKVLRRDNYWCQGCLSTKATTAHHKTYKNVYREFYFELVALCPECHKRFHETTG